MTPDITMVEHGSHLPCGHTLDEHVSYGPYGLVTGSQANYLLPGRDKKLASVCISTMLLSTLFCSTVSPHPPRFSRRKQQYPHIYSGASSSMLWKASAVLHAPQKYTTAHHWVYRRAHSHWEILLHKHSWNYLWTVKCRLISQFSHVN